MAKHSEPQYQAVRSSTDDQPPVEHQVTDHYPMSPAAHPFVPHVSMCPLKGWLGLEDSAGKVWGHKMGR